MTPIAAQVTAPDRCTDNTPLLGFALEGTGHCLDSHVDVRRFGAAQPFGLDAACDTVLDAECELYKSYGLVSLTTFALLPMKGTPVAERGGEFGTVQARVSEYRRSLSAFGFYAERLGQREDRRHGRVRWSVSGEQAIWWSERKVLELSGPEPALASLCQVWAKQAPTDNLGPYELEVLELPGSRCEVAEENLFELPGAGGGVLCTQGDGASDYRTLLVLRRDEASAKDALAWLSRELGGAPIRRKTAVRAVHAVGDGPSEVWFFARQGRAVVGVGANARSARATSSRARQEQDEWRERGMRLLEDLERRVRRTPPPLGE
ncbi:MAG TPA: hypothetical protein VLC09_01760 [Polyangiaceae bacterium]|nr:hypothetical protein [Polyangiaceae bacterium]